jgi:hypothetical protein
MKILLVLLSLLVLATAAYAVNVGDVQGGYPVGFNYNSNGSVNQNFVNDIGQPTTIPFTPTVTAVTPRVGTVQGGYPVGFAYTPGTATPSDAFLDQIGVETPGEHEQGEGETFVREGNMLNNTIRAAQANSPVSNLHVLVAGSNPHSVNELGYYVGYKVISVSW